MTNLMRGALSLPETFCNRILEEGEEDEEETNEVADTEESREERQTRPSVVEDTLLYT